MCVVRSRFNYAALSILSVRPAQFGFLPVVVVVRVVDLGHLRERDRDKQAGNRGKLYFNFSL